MVGCAGCWDKQNENATPRITSVFLAARGELAFTFRGAKRCLQGMEKLLVRRETEVMELYLRIMLGRNGS